MTQATMIYFMRLKRLLQDCDNPKHAAHLISDVALSTSFSKQQRIELVELYREKGGYKYYSCDSCAEQFKTEIDLEAHLFNNRHCQ